MLSSSVLWVCHSIGVGGVRELLSIWWCRYRQSACLCRLGVRLLWPIGCQSGQLTGVYLGHSGVALGLSIILRALCPSVVVVWSGLGGGASVLLPRFRAWPPQRNHPGLAIAGGMVMVDAPGLPITRRLCVCLPPVMVWPDYGAFVLPQFPPWPLRRSH